MKRASFVCILFLNYLALTAQEVEPQTKLFMSMNTNVSFGGGDNKVGISALHFVFDITKPGKFTFGVGSGNENQSSDTFSVSSIPLFFNFQLPIYSNKNKGHTFYFFFRPGFSFAYNATSKYLLDSASTPLVLGRKSNDPNDFIRNTFNYNSGLGYEFKKGFHVELFIRNHPSNLYSPYHRMNDFLGFSLGYRIK